MDLGETDIRLQQKDYTIQSADGKTEIKRRPHVQQKAEPG